MKANYVLLMLLTLLFAGCKKEKSDGSHQILGVWQQCQRDGEYIEYLIGKDHLIMLPESTENEFMIYSNKVMDNAIVITGINVKLLEGVDTLNVNHISESALILEHEYGEIHLTRAGTYHEVDSTDLETWKKTTLDAYKERLIVANCPDLRSDEEKNAKIPLGEVVEEFEEILETPIIQNDSVSY